MDIYNPVRSMGLSRRRDVFHPVQSMGPSRCRDIFTQFDQWEQANAGTFCSRFDSMGVSM
jgi:hypothetical protein